MLYFLISIPQVCAVTKSKNREFTGFAAGGEKGLWFSHTKSRDRRLVLGESAIDACLTRPCSRMLKTGPAMPVWAANPIQNSRGWSRRPSPSYRWDAKSWRHLTVQTTLTATNVWSPFSTRFTCGTQALSVRPAKSTLLKKHLGTCSWAIDRRQKAIVCLTRSLGPLLINGTRQETVICPRLSHKSMAHRLKCGGSCNGRKVLLRLCSGYRPAEGFPHPAGFKK